MFFLRWHDHHLSGDFAESAGAARLAPLYLGDGGVLDVFLSAAQSAGLGAEWRETLVHRYETSDVVRRPVADAGTARRQHVLPESFWLAPFRLASTAQTLDAHLDSHAHFRFDLSFSDNGRLPERARAFIDDVSRRLPPALARSPIVAVTQRPVPRLRPRRILAHWPTDAVWMAVDRAQLERLVATKTPGEQRGSSEPRYTKAFIEELDVLASAPLPAGAERYDEDGSIIFDFVTAGAHVFEAWICDLGLVARRHLNDNDAGDPSLDWSAWATPAPRASGVTLYEGRSRTAFVADVRNGRTISRPEKLEALATAKRDGKLTTGEAVTQIVLVVPVREEAVALAHLVGEGKVDAVVYKDGEYMRDPNVLGESYWKDFTPHDEVKKPGKKSVKKSVKKTKPRRAPKKKARPKR